jgi:dTDP-4-dehydrorhamnose 3,5-epimerase-like enzyme
MISRIEEIKLISLPYFFEENGGLIVIEGLKDLPFNISRVFTVRAPNGSIRGQHAHKKCTQFLTCPLGKVQVLCEDGDMSVEFTLDNPKKGVLIPPGIWAQQTYQTENSILNVFCDMPYDVQDYIRNYDEYKLYINQQHILK